MMLMAKVRHPTNGDWLRAAIHSYYKNLSKESWGEVKAKLSPHSIYSPCARAVQLDLLGYRPPSDPQSIRRMENGSYVHDRWTELLESMGIGSRGERVEGSIIAGTPDLILVHDGDEYLMELKSISYSGFRRLPEPHRNGILNLANLSKVFPDHVAQWLAYDRILLESGKDIGKGYILYECKDNQAFIYFYLVRDGAMFERLAKNAFAAFESLRNGTVIPPPFDRDSPTCNECPAQRVCWLAADGDRIVSRRVEERVKRFLEKWTPGQLR